ncbi:cysteine-rich CWC family protein [Paenibacillus oenotherae]|uniref:Cysteine-rich CWC family protein n=2 Tax=Paenibacillus oenotherae TaxID=1435645 RepID=A0ABS7D490_9BACL|nr:cysteine-rich CWC family protein [Paenibacillus oenotherae]MBW7474752.1 cysteine-rich CWC family protein [Paenibacillus oenotherae]
MAADTAGKCPICGGDNSCGNIAGKVQGACWCSKEYFPEGIFSTVPVDQLGKACICRSCLNKFKERK